MKPIVHRIIHRHLHVWVSTRAHETHEANEVLDLAALRRIVAETADLPDNAKIQATPVRLATDDPDLDSHFLRRIDVHHIEPIDEETHTPAREETPDPAHRKIPVREDAGSLLLPPDDGGIEPFYQPRTDWGEQPW